MRQTKVAHITTIDSSLRYLLLNQLRTIQQVGYEVIGISSPGQDVPVIEAAGIHHIPVRMSRKAFRPFQDLKAVWRLYRIIRQERFDIIHTHNPKPGLLGQIAAKMAGVSVIVNTVHGFYFHDHMHPVLRRFYILLERIAALCSDVILSQNREDVDTAIRLKICPPEKIKYLGNGIDLSIFDPDQLSADGIERQREELGISKEAKVIGFVGRLTAKRKGFLDFLRAGQQVVRRCRNVCLLIVGDADYGRPDAVKPSVAKEYDIWNHCRFLGWRPNSELPILYSLMDILVLPSLFEGIPRTLIEASAMRIPCIATNVKGNREVIEHGRNGLLVPLGDVQALADATVGLLANKENSRRMGQEARRMALERFDERPVFEKVKAEYARLIQRKRFSVSASAAHSQREPSSPNRLTFYRRYGKRLLDLALTIPMLLLLSPVLAFVALIVGAKLGSPVFFRQQRPGLCGQAFKLLKFRTMTGARDARGKLLPDAERLTPFGQLLRTTSLDELPALINVLNGDMSLVGPRPLLMQYLERYTPEQRRRHGVKPGITGWAQVNGRNAISWEEKFKHDVWYVDHQSLWLDMQIIALTVLKILKREHITPEGHVTMPEFKKSGNYHG